MRNSISKILTTTGIFSIILSGFFYWQKTTPNRLAFELKENTFENDIVPGTREVNTPQRLVIEDLNINLPIYPALVKGNNWPATTKGISYLASSPLPGEEGNSVLYGHNWKSLLGELEKAKVGQNIKIEYVNGTEKNFVIKFIQTVSPEDTSILDESNDSRLTLYTCTGFLDSKRLVVTALQEG